MEFEKLPKREITDKYSNEDIHEEIQRLGDKYKNSNYDFVFLAIPCDDNDEDKASIGMKGCPGCLLVGMMEYRDSHPEIFASCDQLPDYTLMKLMQFLKNQAKNPDELYNHPVDKTKMN